MLEEELESHRVQAGVQACARHVHTMSHVAGKWLEHLHHYPCAEVARRVLVCTQRQEGHVAKSAEAASQRHGVRVPSSVRSARR